VRAVAAFATLAAMAAGYAQERRAAIEPVGVWNCLIYGTRGDLRFYLALAPDGAARMARVTEAMQGRWMTLPGWRRSRSRFEMEDPWNGRTFTAELRNEALGGTWHGVGQRGGWWCAPDPTARYDDPQPPSTARLMMELVPAIMASPNYPRQAIREAKQGRAVSCFIVNGLGEISRPGLTELTDEIFREPTLVAVTRSLYRSWGDDDAMVPACRSFTFELRAAG
jgi:hypothetical protein